MSKNVFTEEYHSNTLSRIESKNTKPSGKIWEPRQMNFRPLALLLLLSVCSLSARDSPTFSSSSRTISLRLLWVVTGTNSARHRTSTGWPRRAPGSLGPIAKPLSAVLRGHPSCLDITPMPARQRVTRADVRKSVPTRTVGPSTSKKTAITAPAFRKSFTWAFLPTSQRAVTGPTIRNHGMRPTTAKARKRR